jgi:putative ABC transport system permease protein
MMEKKMFKNYLATAVRNLFRNKLYAVINIGGLAVGLAACILIFIFVRNEMSYDNFWVDAENIYLLEVEVGVPGRLPETFAVTSAPVKAALEKDFVEIHEVTRFFPTQLVVSQGDVNFFEQVIFADENFFEIFKFPFVMGSPEATLGDTASIGISEAMAEKYFGADSAINQTINLTVDGAKKAFRVAGVFSDLPQNTHLALDMIVLLNRADFLSPDGSTFLDDWGNTSLYTYIKFLPGADVASLEAELDAFTDRNVPQSLVDMIGFQASEILNHYLTPLGNIYLGGAQSGRLTPGGDASAVKSFIAIAVLILLISSFNFISLTMASSLLRTREISIRKVFGAKRKNIIIQFLSETLITMSFALAMALLLVEISMPLFNEFISRLILSEQSYDPMLFTGLLGLLVVVSLGAGFYPAFIVSGYRPTRALTSGKAKTIGSRKMRTVFIILQFSISIGLIVSSSVVYFQTSYVKSLDLGYDKENILVLRGISRANVAPLTQTLVQQLEKHPDILFTSGSSSIPFDIDNNFAAVNLAGSPERGTIILNSRYIEEDFFNTYEIPIVTGRNFSENFGTDMFVPLLPDGALPEQLKSAAVLNQAAVRLLDLGTAKETLGQVINWSSGRQLEVIGIIPDIHIMPANYEDEPMLYIWDPTSTSSLSVRYRTNDLPGLLAFVETTWKEIIPGTPIQYVFLSDQIDNSYSNVEARGTMFAVFSVLAVLVSGFGLYGVAALSTEQRTREIGVRKVMGASRSHIIKMMIWQFSRPVLAANLISWPIAWYFLSDWLSGFVYRIELSPVFFIGSGMIALIIAMITVGGHVFRVVRTNPINALRCE